MTVERMHTWWSGRTRGNVQVDPGTIGIPSDLLVGDTLVAVDTGNYSSSSMHLTSITASGVSVVWTNVGTISGDTFNIWVGEVVEPSVGEWEIIGSGPALPSNTNRVLTVTQLRGLLDRTPQLNSASQATGGTAVSPDVYAGAGQVVFGFGYSTTASNAWTATPQDGWFLSGGAEVFTLRYAQMGLRIPQATSELHRISAYRSGGVSAAGTLVLGLEVAPPPLRGVKVYESDSWVDRPLKLFRDGEWIKVAAKKYGDPGWPLSDDDAISATNTTAEVQSILRAVGSEYSVQVSIRPIGTAGSSTIRYENESTIDDGYLVTASKAFVEAIRQYPTALFRAQNGGHDGWEYSIGRTLHWNGSEVSGVYSLKHMRINTDNTDFQLASIPDRRVGGIFITHHETAHGLYQYKTGTALNTFKAEMEAAQPPNWVWMGDSAMTEPFSGDHPLGFPRGYGRMSANEDQADMVAWLLTKDLWERDRAWFETDPYLAAKAAATRKWLTSLGFEGF